MKPGKKAILIVLITIVLAFFVYPPLFNRPIHALNNKIGLKLPDLPDFANIPFRRGLDIVGGTHLVYKADITTTGGQTIDDAMSGVRDVIERRVNLFGVSEPLVQIEGQDHLIVELAGIQDINEAIKLIGQTPFLEFREEKTASEQAEIMEKYKDNPILAEIERFKPTDLTGKYLKRSQVVFDPNTGRPEVMLQLNSEGQKLFQQITKRNIGKQLAIFLDGLPISAPVVNEEINSDSAIISGATFTVQSAKDLVNRLNAGALPVPISLVSQQTIGPSLGAQSLAKSLKAGLVGFLLVAVYMILFYRLPGLTAVLALCVYVIAVLTIYKLLPVTLTLAGIAGFILSLGIAVDANVLIFARLREELAAGKSMSQSFNEGFRRAWLSIRDSHVTTILGAAVLYIFSTSIVKGFALTLGIGVLMSLASSIIVTRAFLRLCIGNWFDKHRWLF